MSEEIKLIINADDNASAKIENVSDELASLGSIARSEALRELGATGADAFLAIAGAAGEYVDIAAEGELVNARLEAQLRALGNQTTITADQINELASELSKTTGYDDEDLVAAQTTLLNFGNMSAEQFDRASRAAADLAAITGQDLQSAFQQVGVAIDTGNWGRLTRQIGDLTDAEKSALRGANDTGDALAAQGIILGALERKTNGAAEAMGKTWTGKMQIARVEVDNFKQSVGDLILNGLNKLPQPAANAALGISDLGKSFSSVAGPIANFVIIAQGLKGGAFAGIGASIAGLKTSLMGFGAALTAPFTAAIAAIGTTVGAIVALGVAIAVLYEAVVVFGPAAWETFTKSLQIVGQEINMLNQVIQALVKRAFVEWIKILNTLWTTVQRVFSGIVTWGKNLYNSLTSVFTSLINGARSWGADIVAGLWDGIQSGWAWLRDNISANMDSLLQWVKGTLGIASPSTVFAEQVGKPIAQGIGRGFSEQMGGVGSTIGTAIMPRTLSPVLSSARGGGVTVVLNYNPGVSIADRQEVAGKLVPYIREAMRRG